MASLYFTVAVPAIKLANGLIYVPRGTNINQFGDVCF